MPVTSQAMYDLFKRAEEGDTDAQSRLGMTADQAREWVTGVDRNSLPARVAPVSKPKRGRRGRHR